MMAETKSTPTATQPGQEPAMTAAQMLLLENTEDSKLLGLAFVPAVILHLVLLVIHLPNFYSEPPAAPEKPKIYVVQQVRFKPPPPEQQQQIPKPKAKKVPVPDPTPDEPEPIRIDEPEDISIPVIDDLIIGIPEAPPEPESTGPIHVIGDVQKPEKISSPRPKYTEIAKRTRIQGVVILQAVINEQGDVDDVVVLKGLPMGLTEAAEEAVRQWKFKPAQLNGKPVAVYFNLTINFQVSS